MPNAERKKPVGQYEAIGVAKTMGIWVVLFFLIKGLSWLIVPLAVAYFGIEVF